MPTSHDCSSPFPGFKVGQLSPFQMTPHSLLGDSKAISDSQPADR